MRVKYDKNMVYENQLVAKRRYFGLFEVVFRLF